MRKERDLVEHSSHLGLHHHGLKTCYRLSQERLLRARHKPPNQNITNEITYDGDHDSESDWDKGFPIRPMPSQIACSAPRAPYWR